MSGHVESGMCGIWLQSNGICVGSVETDGSV